MSDSADGATKGLGIFSTLESATDTPFFLLATAFLLLVDSSLVIFNHAGLLDLIQKPELIRPSLGLEVILVFVGFSFLTAVALPLFVVPIDTLLLQTVGSAWFSLQERLKRLLGPHDPVERRRHNRVRPFELLTAAHEQKDAYLLAQLAEYDKDKGKRTKTTVKTTFYAFYALAMAWVDYFGTAGRAGNPLLRAINDYFQSSAPFVLITAGLLALICARWAIADRPDWIYCPTLYRSLEEREREERERLKSWS